MSDDLLQRSAAYFVGSPGHVLQIAFGIQVVHRDAGARHNVVEMIEEQILPGQRYVVLGIRTPVQRSQGSEHLRIQHGFFGATDSALGFSLRGEDAAVIGEIKFTIPGGNLHAGKFFLQVTEEGASEAELELGKYRVL